MRKSLGCLRNFYHELPECEKKNNPALLHLLIICNKKIKSLPDSKRGAALHGGFARKGAVAGSIRPQNRNPAHEQVQVWTGLVHRHRRAGSGPGVRLRLTQQHPPPSAPFHDPCAGQSLEEEAGWEKPPEKPLPLLTGEGHPSGEDFQRNPRGWGSQERSERPASSVGGRTGAQRSGGCSGCKLCRVQSECKPAHSTQRRVRALCDLGALHCWLSHL